MVNDKVNGMVNAMVNHRIQNDVVLLAREPGLVA